MNNTTVGYSLGVNVNCKELLKSTNLMLRLNLLSKLKSTTSAGKKFHGSTIRSTKKFPQTMTALNI